MDDRQSSDGRELPNRRTTLKLLGTGGAAALAGCFGGGGGGGGTTTGTGTGTVNTDIVPGGHLRTTGISSPASLSPFVGTGQGDYVFFELMYDRLTAYNPDYEVEPELATDWESNDANDEWTFMLTEDATFSGIDQNVIGEDVKATVDVMQSEDRASGTAVDLGPIASDDPVTVEDDYRITISLADSDPFYPKRLGETGSYFNIVPKTVIEDRFEELSTTDFGSGPFELTSYESDNEYVFEAQDYHQTMLGEDVPFLDKVTAKITPDTWLSEYWNQDGDWYASGYAARMEQTTVPNLALGPEAKWDSGRWDNEDYHDAFNKFISAQPETDTFKTNFEEAQKISHKNNAWIVFGFLDQQAAANDYVSRYNVGPAVNKEYYSDAALSTSAPNGPTTTQ